ncbi:sugar ABC transporter ATP-binding protein [Salsipaludibacter albus]|uniref:sugar ABC transporter ATP-binding protein n=1 Tax=Salsipaludibacter albus TaxID=2849650 RepID=UPI001EE497B6|nr:sugar ABC transporter ATP-binding protein [Salsipaludibacter albus]
MPDVATDTAAPILRMTDIVKVFPGVRALDGVDLDVRPGEVHCLLGQNGAGKSTLIKVLSAAHTPEEGTINWLGEDRSFATPLAALQAGLATMYQELDLIDGLTVADNIFLGHEKSRLGWIDTRSSNKRAREIMQRLGHGEIRVRRTVGSLSAAGKQIVSMARALSHDAKLIVMDEPSAVLDNDEVENLFRVIHELTEDGVAIIYISHRLEEIREIGDRVTVLKDGATVATGLDAKSTSTSEIVSLMTGRNVEYLFPERREGTDHLGEVALEVDGLSRTGEFKDVSFDVREGEIVGLAGLVGSGRSEILETIYGARKATSGTVSFFGERMGRNSVTKSVKHGLGLAPEERKSQALLMGQSIARNMSLSDLHKFSTAGWIGAKAEVDDAQAITEQLELRPPDATRKVSTLSGGNQQKVVVGRWLLHGCKILLLDEPTRGVDVGARAELYGLVRELADEGVAVLVVSSEIPEVLGLADRVLVIADGRIIERETGGALEEDDVLDMIMENTTHVDDDPNKVLADDSADDPADDSSTTSESTDGDHVAPGSPHDE